ncbi:hypothetical protein GUJ93_ZPchr0006g43139 [Zizania palustris]|uniref:DUF7903 domain-containing protein n=1 Tax=Zizania palustris TaxID=103762 RepID=A0A8J5VKN5_ZIZPA|nr:hypothetical protein GUJ93_ZPchr0006g43139 [Zizania palustris]
MVFLTKRKKLFLTRETDLMSEKPSTFPLPSRTKRSNPSSVATGQLSKTSSPAAAMAYLPRHKRHSNASTAPTSLTQAPPSLSSSLRSLSLSSPRGRHRHGTAHRQSGNRMMGGMIYHVDCVSRWSPLPPFSADPDDDASLCLQPFPWDTMERKTGAKPFALVPSSSAAEASLGSAEEAAYAIAEKFLPDLLAAADRAKAGDVPQEKDEVKLSVVARVGRVLFRCGGSPVTMNSLRKLVKAGEEGSRSRVCKLFHTNVPAECLDAMEQSAAKKMGLEFDSSKELYHVKVLDKHQSDSTISCKCTVQEDGKLAIHKVELKHERHLVEDISCLFKDLDLRLMLCTKRILKNLDAEVENAINCLVSSAIIDPDVQGGLRWSPGKESIDGRFHIVGAWHSNYKAFRNETLRLKLRHADRFDHQSLTAEVSDEVTFKLIGISGRLEAGERDVNSFKEMLESAVQMIWDSALSYKMAA